MASLRTITLIQLGMPQVAAALPLCCLVGFVEKEAQRDSKLLRGDVLVEYSFSGRVLAMATATGKVLTIFVGGFGVEWDVVTADACGESHDLPPIMQLRFPSGQEHEWAWKSLLDSMLRHPIQALSPSEATVSLYVEDCPDLIFTALVARDSGEKLLFFGEE